MKKIFLLITALFCFSNSRIYGMIPNQNRETVIASAPQQSINTGSKNNFEVIKIPNNGLLYLDKNSNQLSLIEYKKEFLDNTVEITQSANGKFVIAIVVKKDSDTNSINTIVYIINFEPIIITKNNNIEYIVPKLSKYELANICGEYNLDSLKIEKNKDKESNIESTVISLRVNNVPYSYINYING